MTETILIAGSGIAGLSAAMALSAPGREIIVLDRDPEPPEGSVNAVFDSWARKGATQLRHSHVFLGRLVKLLRETHPALWSELTTAGAREFTFEDGLPPQLRSGFRGAAGDEDLSILFSRRTTLELVMRRYAEGLPGVRFEGEAAVRGVTGEMREGVFHVSGLRVTRGGHEEVMTADLVIDATGRGTQFPEWLRSAGVAIAEEESPAGILYFTRHYRLRDGQDEPPRGIIPGAGDLGYLKFGVFAADNRHFSITLACPEIETGLRVALPRPDVFDAVCAALPGVARWTDPARAEPASKVFAMGNLRNLWRSYVKDGAAQAANFIPLGDALFRTNPLYGRGCSTGAISAFLLADVLKQHADGAARLTAYETGVRQALRPFFDAMVKQDKQAIKRAQNEQNPGYRPRLKSRVMTSFIEDGIGPATRGDLTVLRALMRPFHMYGDPESWTRQPGVMLRILAMWARPKRLKAHLYPPKLGPDRASMLAQLSL